MIRFNGTCRVLHYLGNSQHKSRAVGGPTSCRSCKRRPSRIKGEENRLLLILSALNGGDYSGRLPDSFQEPSLRGSPLRQPAARPARLQEPSRSSRQVSLLALQVAFQHLVNHNADSQTSELLWLQRSVTPSVRPSNGLAVLGSGNKRHTVVRLSRISDKLGRSSARPQRNTKRGTTFLADSLTVAERAGRPR
jgi:hypothetical protein